MKAVEKDRARRYATADALAQDIVRHLHGQPVTAVPPSRAYLLRMFIRRNKRAVISAFLFGLLLTVGTIISTWQAIRATRQTLRAVAAEKSVLENFDLANKNLKLATESELMARRTRYAAEMMLAQGSANGLSSENVYELLKRQIPEPGEADFRGFEWRRLWNNYRRELFRLEGHTDELRSVAMSPDGRWLVSRRHGWDRAALGCRFST